MGWPRQRKQLPPLRKRAVPRALSGPSTLSKYWCSAKKGLGAGATDALPLHLHRTRWVMPTSGASVTCPCSPRTRTLSNSTPPANGDSSSTTGQSQSRKQWGWERELEGHLSLSLTPSPSGGTVSMATCSATSGSLKGPWRYTRCPKSWMTSADRGEGKQWNC